MIVAVVQKNTRDDLRIRLTEFMGHRLCDVRQFTDLGAEGAERRATKKGVAFNVAVLPELIAALRAAEDEARSVGWI